MGGVLLGTRARDRLCALAERHCSSEDGPVILGARLVPGDADTISRLVLACPLFGVRVDAEHPGLEHKAWHTSKRLPLLSWRVALQVEALLDADYLHSGPVRLLSDVAVSTGQDGTRFADIGDVRVGLALLTDLTAVLGADRCTVTTGQGGRLLRLRGDLVGIVLSGRRDITDPQKLVGVD